MKFPRIWKPWKSRRTSKYMPHQGARECARRRQQVARLDHPYGPIG